MISSPTSRAAYTLSSTTETLPVPFYFLENSHLRVIKTVGGVDTQLFIGTHFTATGAGVLAGGAITLTGTGVAVGNTITIKRLVPLTQLVDYVANNRFPADTHEKALDKLTMICQYLGDEVLRSLRLQEGEAPILPLSLNDRKGKGLMFDATTGEVEFYDVQDVLDAADAAAASQAAAQASENAAAASAEAAASYRAKIEVATMTALEALSVVSFSVNDYALVRGYYADGDGGGGFFQLVSSTATVSPILRTVYGDANKRWKRVEQPDGVLTLRHFGAYGDLVNNDSPALLAALDWWGGVDNMGRTLQVTSGDYLISTPCRRTFNNPSSSLGRIDGHGGKIHSRIVSTVGIGTIGISNNVLQGSGTAFTSQLTVGDHIVANGNDYTVIGITNDTTAEVAQDQSAPLNLSAGQSFVIWPPAVQFYANTNARRPCLQNLVFVGHSSVTGGVLLQFLGQNGEAENWDGIQLNDCRFGNLFCTGLEITKGVFESNINNVDASGPDGGDRDLIRVLSSGNVGDVSSVNIYAPNMRGGKRCLVCRGSDFHIHGGTAILAKQYGAAFFDFSGGIFGFHVENNWYGVAAADGQAGLYINSYRLGVVSGVFGIRGAGLSGQKHTLRSYLLNGGNLVCLGVTQASGISGDNSAYLEGLTSGHAIMVGCGSFTEVFGACTVSNFVNGRLRENVKGARVAFYNMGATVTPDLSRGGFLDIASITGPFTIANHTNWTAAPGDELTINLRNEATGGYAVSFGSEYSLVSSLTTTANKTTIIRFVRNASNKWQEVFRSVVS